MKVSVVIPAHNEEKYIGDCLDSLINQEEKPDEIIVVDNNCTDKTVEICKKYKVRVVKEETSGIIAARNAGFNAADYEIIVRCDADGFAPPNWIKKIKENFTKKPIVALGGPLAPYDLPFKSLSLRTTFFSNAYSYATKKIYKNHVLMGANMALKKSTWDQIKHKTAIKDNHVHEDVDITMLIGEIGEIGFDKKLIMATSARRIKRKPHSFFVQYPVRMLKTYRRHSKAGKN